MSKIAISAVPVTGDGKSGRNCLIKTPNTTATCAPHAYAPKIDARPNSPPSAKQGRHIRKACTDNDRQT
ncbi:MAG: hypothetical protein RSB47_06420 [Ruthenibacterium sp.]